MADSFEKRKRERRKQEKRQEKELRKLDRETAKHGEGPVWTDQDPFSDGPLPPGGPGLSGAEDGLDSVRPSQESSPRAGPPPA